MVSLPIISAVQKVATTCGVVDSVNCGVSVRVGGDVTADGWGEGGVTQAVVTLSNITIIITTTPGRRIRHREEEDKVIMSAVDVWRRR
jgi:hypothetical protein